MRKNYDDPYTETQNTSKERDSIPVMPYALSAISCKEEKTGIRGWDIDFFGIFSVAFKKIFDFKRHEKLGE